jgi:hypothetical protein
MGFWHSGNCLRVGHAHSPSSPDNPEFNAYLPRRSGDRRRCSWGARSGDTSGRPGRLGTQSLTMDPAAPTTSNTSIVANAAVMCLDGQTNQQLCADQAAAAFANLALSAHDRFSGPMPAAASKSLNYSGNVPRCGCALPTWEHALVMWRIATVGTAGIAAACCTLVAAAWFTLCMYQGFTGVPHCLALPQLPAMRHWCCMPCDVQCKPDPPRGTAGRRPTRSGRACWPDTSRTTHGHAGWQF